MSAELRRTTNDDTDYSGFDIAPNLIFPAALALGYDWMPPGEATLRESERPQRRCCVSDPEQFQWKLHRADISGDGLVTQGSERRLWRGSEITHFDVDSSAAYRIVCISQPNDGERARSRVKSVWLLEYRLSDTDCSHTGRPFVSELRDEAEGPRIIHVGRASNT